MSNYLSIKNKFNLPPKLSQAVLFSIIEEKNATRRKYKVCWVVNYDKQAILSAP